MADTMEVVLDLNLPATRIDLPQYARESELSDGTSGGLNFDDASLRVPSFSRHAFVSKGVHCDLSLRVLGNGFDVEITPLAFEYAQLEGDGAKLSFHSPYKLRSQCVQLIETEEGVFLSLVTVNGLLYIVQIDKSRFATQQTCSSPNSATVSTTLISEHQRLLKTAIASCLQQSNMLLVSTHTGDLVKLELNTKELTYLMNHERVGFFQRFLKSGVPEHVPNYPEVAMSAITCIQKLSDSQIVSYAMDSSVQIWDLSTNRLKCSVKPTSVLKLRPSQNVCVANNRIFIGHANKLEIYNLNLDLEVSIEYPANVENWFVNSVIQTDLGTLVAVKMNLDARVLLYTSEWTEILRYDANLNLELADDVSVESTCERVLQMDFQVVKTCLTSIAPSEQQVINCLSHAELAPFLGHLFSGPLESQQWAKFENMCREVASESTELLSIYAAQYTGFYTMTVNSTNLITHEVLPPAVKTSFNELNTVIADLFVDDLVLSEFALILSSRISAVECLEQTCALLKPVLDQSKLNLIGSEHGSTIVNSLKAFREFYGPLSVTKHESSNEQLTLAGKFAVNELLHTFATKTERTFLCSAALSALAIVEGWDDSMKCSSEFEKAVQEYKLVSFYNLFSSVHVDQPLKQEILTSMLQCNVHSFGPRLAQHLLNSFCQLDALAWLLYMPEFSLQDAAKFSKLANMLQPTSKLWFLKGLASLKSGEELEAEKLFRKVSIARPWIPMLGIRPAVIADWYARVAEYAASLNAFGTAFQLAKTASTLADERAEHETAAHVLLFNLSLKQLDFDMAYTALTRRFSANSDESHEWIEQLLTSACARGFETCKPVLESYIYTGFATTVQEVLKSKPQFGSVHSYQLLYTWHVARKNYIAAASEVYAYAKTTSDKTLERDLLTVCANALELEHEENRFISSLEGIVSYKDVKQQIDM